jgi:hypothetical protein
MKITLIVLCLVTGLLGYRVLQLEDKVRQLQTNTAIAVLSAEAANKKIGAFAPFFAPDKDAFATAWLDSLNMPLAVFPDEILAPLKNMLQEKRMSPESQQLQAMRFK